MPLSNLTVKHLKPRERPYKKSDGAGLYIRVEPSGTKLWRLRYRFNGKEKTMTFGVYPAVTLKEARKQNRAARQLIARGIDPMRERKKAKAKAKANPEYDQQIKSTIDAVLLVLDDKSYYESLKVLSAVYLGALSVANEGKPLEWFLLEIQKDADTLKQLATLIGAGNMELG